VCNDTLYFRAKGTDNIQDLYEFNSTDSFKLAYVWSGTRRHIYPTYLASYKNKLYFNGIPQWGQYNLIEFDGHNTPTVVHFINGVGNHSQSVDMTTVGDELFFRANTYDKGYELYRYNGVDTPKLVIDMVPGTGTSVPQNFVDFNGDLIYTAFDLINGRELRRLQTGSKTSGIPELIADYSPGNESSMPFNLMEYNDKLYFAAEDGVHGRELWEYDGTNEPELVSNFTIGNGHSLSTNMPKPVVYKNKMVYLGAQSSFPYLMEYDGDTLIAKVNMYQQDFRTVSTQMIVFKDNVYFDAFKFSNRRELYKYDGDTV